MNTMNPAVLLVGKAFRTSAHLREKLQYWDCEFHFAASCAEAHDLLNRYRFDLVLSETTLPDDRASTLISRLIGSPTTLFLSFHKDGTSWWLPAIDHGQPCWGAQAMRPGEFARVLDKTLYEVVSGAVPMPPHSVPAIRLQGADQATGVDQKLVFPLGCCFAASRAMSPGMSFGLSYWGQNAHGISSRPA